MTLEAELRRGVGSITLRAGKFDLPDLLRAAAARLDQLEGCEIFDICVSSFIDVNRNFPDREWEEGFKLTIYYNPSR